MPTERQSAYWQRVKLVEGLVLLTAAPFLLFPQRFVSVTAFFLILLAGLWIAPLLIVRSPLIPVTPYNAALFVFTFFVGVAILVTADRLLTLPKASIIILGLGIWRYLVLAVQQRSQLQWALTGYLVVGLGFILIGLLNADWLSKTTSAVPILGPLSQQVSGTLSISADFGIHPNQVAGTITLVLPLLLALFTDAYDNQRKVDRWIFALASLFCGLALLLSQSRSGWAGVLGGFLTLLVLWGVTMKPAKGRIALWIATGLIIAALLLLIIGFGPQRMQQFWLNPPNETAVGSLSTLNFRQDLWPWAIQGIKDFPYTGIGLGTFREAARRLYPVPINPAYDFAHAHNVFLQVGLDVGIPGLISYIAILLISGVVAWKIINREPPLRAISAGLLASLAAFHVYGLTDTLALGSKTSILLWGIFGLLAAMTRLR